MECDFQRFYNLDLGHEIYSNKINTRRFSALVHGLPGEATVWREDFFSPVEERLVQLMERQDSWFRALFELTAGEKKISVPGQISVPRPGSTEEWTKPKRSVVSDIHAIKAWFGSNG